MWTEEMDQRRALIEDSRRYPNRRERRAALRQLYVKAAYYQADRLHRWATLTLRRLESRRGFGW